MKNMIRLARRFTLILLASVVVLGFANLVFLALLSHTFSGDRPWETTQKLADSLKSTEHGYQMDQKGIETLQKKQLWAVLVDNHSLLVLWKSDDLPSSVPQTFDAALVTGLRTGYLDSYPTFTADSPYGLFVVGYPKNTFWKLGNPSWSMKFISHTPVIALLFLAGNLAVLVLIYLASSGKLLKSLGPLAEGIQSLPTRGFTPVKETGPLKGLAQSINQAAKILQSQQKQLRKKDTARANWIAGVSHDIRTPLSIVLGYAIQLSTDTALPEEAQKKSAVIVRQSEKMKKLIIDLNLASKLEYNMQPLHMEKVSPVALTRQVAADCINNDLGGCYPVEFTASPELSGRMICGDRELLRRAIENLIQNSMNHNETGCHLFLSVTKQEETCFITVEDDGIGATDEEIDRLNHTPHYMMCDSSTSKQRHGLGLLIVRQVADSHQGNFFIGHSRHGGFLARIALPLSAEEDARMPEEE